MAATASDRAVLAWFIARDWSVDVDAIVGYYNRRGRPHGTAGQAGRLGTAIQTLVRLEHKGYVAGGVVTARGREARTSR